MLAGFRWIIPNTLAGSAQPGLLDELDADIACMRELGIARIVTLTRRPLPDSVAAAGFDVTHFPISDMGIPTPRACTELCTELVAEFHERGRPVLLHCRGGLGRTGTVAACCLVNLGRTPDEALLEVRRANPNFVQSPAQVQFITHYADWFGRERADSEA